MFIVVMVSERRVLFVDASVYSSIDPMTCMPLRDATGDGHQKTMT